MLCYYGYARGYAAETVSQWTPTFSLHNPVNKTCTYSKLFCILIVFTRRTFYDICQQNRSIFTCLTPVEPKTCPFPFSSVTTKQYIVDWSNYTFSESCLTRRICWYGFWQHWSNFWIWPLYKLSCDPQRLPVQDVTWQQYEILILGPIPT